LIASSERSTISKDSIDDWIEGISSCAFTVAVDGDATLQGQILLQEQGFRLYPNYSKFIITAILKQIFQGSNQNVAVDEYYMDTNYNSDPELYDAKQVLLQVVLTEDGD
jgi:hypothetical protein